MKKRLLNQARQRHLRRTTIFYFLEQPRLHATQSLGQPQGQLELQGIPQTLDRPRTAREMFADIEYDDGDER